MQRGVGFPDPCNLVRNPSLETDADANQIPDCWQRGGFGTNTASFTLVSDASDGVRAQQLTVSSPVLWRSRLVTAQDTGACAPPVTAGHRYTVSAFYKATVQPRLTVYYRNSSGAWVWFAESPLLPVASTYRQASFTTRALPAGATAISFGLGIFAVGTITIDQHVVVDTVTPRPTDTSVPLLSTACNGATCSTQPYGSAVLISNDADPGVAELRYTVDGSDPTTGTPYTGEFALAATATVRATAVDTAGNRTFRSTPVTITPDTTPPVLAIDCDGATCSTSAYSAPVTVTLTASDPGTGVREIRYTIDGSDPVIGAPYAGPFTVGATATVRSTAVDNAGNRTSLTTTITSAPDTTPRASRSHATG